MKTMKKAQTGKKLPKAGEQTPADFYPKSYDKYPRTPGGGANYPEPNGKRGVGPAAKKPKMKMGGTMKKAQMGTDMMQSPMMKKGGAMKKCKYGCK